MRIEEETSVTFFRYCDGIRRLLSSLLLFKKKKFLSAELRRFWGELLTNGQRSRRDKAELLAGCVLVD